MIILSVALRHVMTQPYMLFGEISESYEQGAVVDVDF